MTSVIVSCAPTSYTIGGTISDLSAGGLVLANGNDTVSSAVSATAFVFFIDIHPYADTGLRFSQYAQNFGFAGYQQQTPVVMAEFGAFPNAVPLIAEAAADLKNWQIAACQAGVTGSLL